MTNPITVRPISEATHEQWASSHPGVSFLQTPAWGRVKPDWRAQSIGWFDGTDLTAAALVLYRPVPRTPRSLAYLPEGPALDFAGPRLREHLDALVAHVRREGAFAVRIGPIQPTARWARGRVMDALADDRVASLADLPPDSLDPVGQHAMDVLRAAGFALVVSDSGFGAGQARHMVHVDLTGDEPAILARMSQQWRRNIKKADKAGVVVTEEGAAALTVFHELYRETAARDRFTGRPLSYFEVMYRELSAADPDRVRVYVARHDDVPVAATIWVRLGELATYSYGGSATARREVQGSTAIQWRMIRDARAAGATTYDLRGVTESLLPDDHYVGLLRFKLGTGGDLVQYVGEWDLPMPGTGRLFYRAFDTFLRQRSRLMRRRAAAATATD